MLDTHRQCMTPDAAGNTNPVTLKACSHQAKANAKAKKIKEQSEEIKNISGKHQRKFSLSLGVGMP